MSVIAQDSSNHKAIEDTLYHNLMIQQGAIQNNDFVQDSTDIEYALEAIEYYLEQLAEERKDDEDGN